MGRTIDDVADQLKLNKANGASCVLLIGAGCSVTAGIPLASDFVRQIKEKFPRKYDLAPEKTYPACMRELAPSERHELISTAIDEAKINLAHIAIAQMMKSGHVDRVLTTNFDPLVMRACALFNIFPAVYDMTTAGERFRPSWVRDRAVFHLHGQRDGFFQAHTSRDVEALERSLDPLFRDCASRRTWLVVGYSGANDPVFRQLKRMPEFGHDLYWVPYKGEPMPPHLESLMHPARGGHWLDGDWDADTFLVQLANRIECPDAPFLTHPFIHLREELEQIGTWTLPGESHLLPIAENAIRKVDRAINDYEPESSRYIIDSDSDSESILKISKLDRTPTPIEFGLISKDAEAFRLVPAYIYATFSDTQYFSSRFMPAIESILDSLDFSIYENPEIVTGSIFKKYSLFTNKVITASKLKLKLNLLMFSIDYELDGKELAKPDPEHAIKSQFISLIESIPDGQDYYMLLGNVLTCSKWNKKTKKRETAAIEVDDKTLAQVVMAGSLRNFNFQEILSR